MRGQLIESCRSPCPVRADEHDFCARFDDGMPLLAQQVKQGRLACSIGAGKNYEVAEPLGLCMYKAAHRSHAEAADRHAASCTATPLQSRRRPAGGTTVYVIGRITPERSRVSDPPTMPENPARQHPLRGELAARDIGGRRLDQWQYEVTAGGRASGTAPMSNAESSGSWPPARATRRSPSRRRGSATFVESIVVRTAGDGCVSRDRWDPQANCRCW